MFLEIETELHLVPLCGIDYANACIELIAELNGSNGDVTWGCFLENGDIILAHKKLQSDITIYQFQA